jgi:hypothetical protein
MVDTSPSLSREPERPLPRGGGKQPSKGQAERQRLLRRLHVEAQTVTRAAAALKVKTRRLSALEARRPLTGEEHARAQALRQANLHLRSQIQQLRTEFAALQRRA